MSIAPASIDASSASAASAYYLEDVDDAEPEASVAPDDVRRPIEHFMPAGVANLQSGIAALEQRFTAFSRMLTRELASLERQFTTALRSLFGAVKRATGTQAPGAGSAADPDDGTRANSATAQPRALSGYGNGTISPYDGIIRRAGARYGVDPALISAVVRQESGFHADAVSGAGAVGLMQLMPSTARELGVANPFDAEQNVDGGTQLLRSLLDRYGGRLDDALAAYNAGPAAVDKYGGVPPYPETQTYVASIMTAYRDAALTAGQEES